MEQGFLFEPKAMLESELRIALERLDLEGARGKLEELRRLWPAHRLTWEPEVLQEGLKLAQKHLNLDKGYEAWLEWQNRLSLLRVPDSQVRVMRRHFFSRLVAANRALFEDLWTPKGRRLGDFYLLAGQPNNARRRYEKLIRQNEDGWEIRLCLGNCNFLLGLPRIGHSNYLRSFLLGLPDSQWRDIEDRVFLEKLKQADVLEWAFPQLCVEDMIPSVRFSSMDDFKGFKARFADKLDEAPKRFCYCWIVSENRALCGDEEFFQMRRQMKALHPELHSRYMDRLAQP